LDLGDEVDGVLSSDLFNTKVVDDEVERDYLDAVFEEAGGVTGGDIVAVFRVSDKFL